MELQGKSKWVPGILRTQLGPLSYEVEIGPHLVWRRHTDQIKDSNGSYYRRPYASYPAFAVSAPSRELFCKSSMLGWTFFFLLQRLLG